jgi:conjugative transfer signal peptidase TraF
MIALVIQALRRRRRSLAIRVLAACVVTMATLAGAVSAGLRVNTTASMPVGLWYVRAGEPIKRGVIVTICPHDCEDFREALRRGYITHGRCPGGYEPLVKPVAAVAGDLVTVTRQGIAVNGNVVANTAALAEDEIGRPLHQVPPGIYRVASGEVWLLSGHDIRSFDSRYFGALPFANVRGVAHPLWVLR